MNVWGLQFNLLCETKKYIPTLLLAYAFTKRNSRLHEKIQGYMDFHLIYYFCPQVSLSLKDMFNETGKNTLYPNTQNYTLYSIS